MAISRERRAAIAELMTATIRLQTAKAALKDENETDENTVLLIGRVVECLKRAQEGLEKWA